MGRARIRGVGEEQGEMRGVGIWDEKGTKTAFSQAVPGLATGINHTLKFVL